MAKTYPRRALKVVFPNDVLQQAAIITYLDGNHTVGSGIGVPFLAGWPLQDDGGGRVIGWDSEDISPPIIQCFAAEDSPNVLGAPVRAYRNVSGYLLVEGNAMDGPPAVDTALSQSDMIELSGIRFDPNFLGTGKPGYFISDQGSVSSVRIVDFRTSYIISNADESVSVAGDINARVRAIVTDAFLPTAPT